MLRIEEIVGAMDDEFRYALDSLDDSRLEQLKADKAALRRLRPVGVSHAEALAMIDAILERRERARTSQSPPRPKRKPAAPRRRKPPAPEPPPPAPPACAAPLPLPGPVTAGLLEAPRARLPAIRLPAPEPEVPPAIRLPAPPPAPPPVSVRTARTPGAPLLLAMAALLLAVLALLAA